MEKISFCKNDEIEELKTFIHEKWQKNHILSKHQILLDFQHKHLTEYNFVISKNEKNKITAILGFIPLSQFDQTLYNNKDIWLAIWKVDDDAGQPGIGFTLLKWLEKKINPNSIGSIGINQEVKKIYDVLGYKTGILNHFYILNPQKAKFNIAIAENNSDEIIRKQSNFTIKEISVTDISEIPIKAIPKKSINYYKNRYLNHPIYKYLLLGVYYNNLQKVVFIVRKVTAGSSTCLRIVDIIGDIEGLGDLKSSFLKIINIHNSEYIDCLNYGIKPEYFSRIGFSLRTPKIVIPNYFEPFIRENVEITFAYKSKNENYTIFKGDSDQDRPNILY